MIVRVVIWVCRALVLVALTTGCGRLNFESARTPGGPSEAGTPDGQQSDARASGDDAATTLRDARVVDGRVLDATLFDAMTDARAGDAASVQDGGTADAGAGCMGVSGAPIFCDSFEYTSILGTPWSVGLAGSFTNVGYAGSRGARAQIQVAGETSSISLRDLSSLAAMNNGLFYLRVHIRTANEFDQFDNVRLISLYEQADVLFSVGIDNDTVVFRAGDIRSSSTVGFPRGRWVCVTAEIQLGASGHTRYWIDDQSLLSINHSVIGPPTGLALGILSSGANSSDLDVHIDELVIDDQPISCLP